MIRLTESEFRKEMDKLRRANLRFDLSSKDTYEAETDGWKIILSLDDHDQAVACFEFFSLEGFMPPEGETAGLVTSRPYRRNTSKFIDGKFRGRCELSPQKAGTLGFIVMDASNDADSHGQKLSQEDVDKAIQEATYNAKELRKSRELTPRLWRTPVTDW